MMEKKMETTTVYEGIYWGYIGILEKKMEGMGYSPVGPTPYTPLQSWSGAGEACQCGSRDPRPGQGVGAYCAGGTNQLTGGE